MGNFSCLLIFILLCMNSPHVFAYINNFFIAGHGNNNTPEVIHIDIHLYVCVCVFLWYFAWWRHQMETFSALLALCARNSPVTGDFPSQLSVKRNFDVFFDQRLNNGLSKQSIFWWFETPLSSLCRNSLCHMLNFACWLSCNHVRYSIMDIKRKDMIYSHKNESRFRLIIVQ